MRTGCIILLIALMPGCAAFMEGYPPGTAARDTREADRLTAEGNFSGARDSWLRTARERRGSPAGERAAYHAALLLVHPRNPAKNYRQAQKEFQAYAESYPAGQHAAEAAAWLGALDDLEQTRVNELLAQVDALGRKLDDASAVRRKTEAERDAAARERDALSSERNDLKKCVDELLAEKEAVIAEKTAALRERDGLSRDKAALEKKVETLTREKERLTAARARLEQRLRDVTDVDIRMEKKRKKMQ